jgi:hypothetical protein
MRTPILVIDDDIDVFETVIAAEKCLEAADVRRGRMLIYDRDGRLVRPVITRRLLAEVVRLEEHESPEVDMSRVRGALVRFLEGREPALERKYEELSIDQLFDRALQYKTQ